MAKSTPDQLSMFSPTILGDLHNATSLLVLPDGHMHSDWQDGRMIKKSGQAAARANRLASRVKEKGLMMSGTYGRTFFDSSLHAVPRSLWVSKLQEQLAMVGSTESDLTWKVKTTPAKASIFRLAPSTRRISDQDCIGWRTPNTRDGMQSGYSDMEKLQDRWDRGKQVQLCDQVKMATTWKTPQVADSWDNGIPRALRYKGNAPSEERNTRNPELMGSYRGELKDFVGHLYYGQTPSKTDGGIEKAHHSTKCDKTSVASTWPTPNTSVIDAKPNPPITSHRKPTDPQISTADVAIHLYSGTMPNTSQAPTEKRGALNPEFVSWLMGFPPEWESCAPTAMPSSRKSRQK